MKFNCKSQHIKLERDPLFRVVLVIEKLKEILLKLWQFNLSTNEIWKPLKT